MTKTATPAPVDIDSIEDLQEADIEITHPKTGAIVGTIRMLGPEHPVRRRMLFARIDRLNNDSLSGLRPGAEEHYEEMNDELADIVSGWNLVMGGKPLPFSKQAARELLSDPRRGWLRAQLVAARDNRERFIGASANG